MRDAGTQAGHKAQLIHRPFVDFSELCCCRLVDSVECVFRSSQEQSAKPARAIIMLIRRLMILMHSKAVAAPSKTTPLTCVKPFSASVAEHRARIRSCACDSTESRPTVSRSFFAARRRAPALRRSFSGARARSDDSFRRGVCGWRRIPCVTRCSAK